MSRRLPGRAWKGGLHKPAPFQQGCVAHAAGREGLVLELLRSDQPSAILAYVI